MIEIVDRARLPADRLSALTAELASMATLAAAIRWGFTATPRREIVNIVVQDEYTHDVVMQGPDGLYLCFDTT